MVIEMTKQSGSLRIGPHLYYYPPHTLEINSACPNVYPIPKSSYSALVGVGSIGAEAGLQWTGSRASDSSRGWFYEAKGV